MCLFKSTLNSTLTKQDRLWDVMVLGRLKWANISHKSSITAANVADDIQNGHNWFGICVHNNVMHFPAKSRWSLAHGLVGHFYGCMVATSSVDSCRYIQYTISCSSPYYCWQMWVSTSAASNLFNTTIRGDSSSALLATLTLVVVHHERFYHKRQPLLHKI